MDNVRNPLPQNEALATYTKIITKADGKVDWSKTAGEIYNQFRAFYPWPGLWTTWQGKILKLTDIQINPLQKTTEPGKIGKVLIDGIVICGNGTSFKIKTLQLEGKTEMTVSDFVNGNRNFLGSLLG